MELLAFGDKLFHPFHSNIVCMRDSGLMVADPLYPSEQLRIKNAVPKRVREFTSGRSLARRALIALGQQNPGPIDSCRFGSPIWPEGVVGSISHTDDEAIAAVARMSEISSIGIDIESDTPLEPCILNLVCNRHDHKLRQNTFDLPVDWAKLVFSAKEAFYKAVFPQLGRQLDFKDAAVNFTLSSQGTNGTFEIIPNAARRDWPEFSLCLKGNWIHSSHHIYCAAIVPASTIIQRVAKLR